MNEKNQRRPNDGNVKAIVLAAQRGDREAFGLLYDRYEQSVRAVAYRRLGDWEAANDLCHEAFVQALLKLDQLQNPHCFGSWIHRIVGRLAINRLNRGGRLVATDPASFDGYGDDKQTPLKVAIKGERAEQLREGLLKLRPMDRQTLEAFYVEGQSLAEMSDRFQAPVGTIKRRLHVARKRLAQQVQPLAV